MELLRLFLARQGHRILRLSALQAALVAVAMAAAAAAGAAGTSGARPSLQGHRTRRTSPVCPTRPRSKTWRSSSVSSRCHHRAPAPCDLSSDTTMRVPPRCGIHCLQMRAAYRLHVSCGRHPSPRRTQRSQRWRRAQEPRARNAVNGCDDKWVREPSHRFFDMQVQDILLLRHSDTGNPRGAFAEFAGPEDLEAALQMDGEVCCMPTTSACRQLAVLLLPCLVCVE